MNNKKIKNTLSDALNSAGKQEAFLDNLSNKTRYQHVKSRQGLCPIDCVNSHKL